MSTEELLGRTCFTIFALPSANRQVNPAGHTVQLVALELCWGTYVLQRRVFSHIT